MVRAVWLSIFGLGVLAWGACSDDTGETGEGGSGATASDGGGGSGATGGAGGEATGGGGGGACVAFAESCAMTDVCCDAAGLTGECFAFGMGPRCTIPCPADPADCPNNGAGCNNQTPPYCKTN